MKALFSWISFFLKFLSFSQQIVIKCLLYKQDRNSVYPYGGLQTGKEDKNKQIANELLM